ncbi:autotransporter subunit beta [uncultured Selenomonas sp.]|uniref:autotransporter subunit beta n=1 Tax=uncultured Selenomonas sp. TaxID=159275 RepID=UPI0028EB987C|nr:autotransporter subunit beta [uncultured Selenomonas sp.]
MFNKKFSRPSLALFIAIALSGGAFFAPSFASGADVTIDSTHPPQRNVPNPDAPSTPNSAASVGTGSEDASGNSLTVNQYQEDTLSVFGGVARGIGNADGNTVRIKGATTEIASIYGGAAWGTGHARENRVHFDAGTMSFAEWLVGGYVGRSGEAEENTVEVNGGKTESLYGGFSNSTNAVGRIHRNHVVIRGGTIAGKVYGGAFGGAHATGDVTHNTVTITGGTLKREVCGGSLEKADSTGNVAHNEVTVAGGVFRGDVYGGYTRRGGALTGNIVTITGGELNNVYAAYSSGNVSEIKGNVVNLGDGKNEMKAGYRIAKYIFGASGGNRASYAGNTLNVKASAQAKNIVNFDKVNFYFTDTLQPRLTLRDSTGTKFKSLKDIAIYGSPSTPAGTLIENNTSGGVVVRDGVNTVVRTGDTAEVTLEKDATGRKILYSRLIFKGATTAESDGTHIWGGRSAIGNTTTGNDVALANGSYANAYGGWTTGAGSDAAADRLGDSTGNKITVSGTATATGTVYGGYTDAAGGKARGNTVTIESAVHDVVGGEGAGEASGNIVNIRANAAAVTGGRSAGAASNNRVTLGNITATSVVGGDGAATAEGNTVSLDGTTVTNDVIGGRGAAANGNAVSLSNTHVNGAVIGGYGTVQSDSNTINLQNATVDGTVTGGYGTATSGNIIHLRNTVVNGIVTGGTASGGVGNTLAVYYSAGASSIHDFKGIENLRLDVEDAPTDGTAHPLLKLTNVSGGSKNLTNMTLDFRRSGAARKLQAGDSFTLLENASGKITVGEGVTMKGTDGIAHDCLFAIAPDQAHPEKLRATVTKTGVGETAKSPVETRAGLANFVNQGADYLVESGFTAAEMSAENGAKNASADDTAELSSKDTQRRTAASDSASYHLWAGAGANAMRVESGSHVDSKGWNLGVGWAREDAAKGGTKRLFSPFVEYGRGTYDSYLDNGAHGSGKLSYFGLGVLGKLTQQDGLWLEASARAGRAKSDYSLHGENAGYDGSNAYYGIHLGVGKTFMLQKDASLDAYVRYFWSHQDGMSVKLRGSGDAYDFADVDSHRLRLGLRYSRKDRSAGECYAGLAWEHELGGEASASVGGDAAPSPSLKGSSCMLELGYRFLPQNSRISYDFHINGWQGKRKGLSGGAAIQWTF